VKLRRRRLRRGPPRCSIGGSALRYQLEGMEPGDTGDCTPHHLELAGRSNVLFSDDSIPLIQEVPPDGLPRPVNNLAAQALIAAHVARELARFPEDELFSD
jgi:type II secretory pathway predicted ATPase ExeA